MYGLALKAFWKRVLQIYIDLHTCDIYIYIHNYIHICIYTFTHRHMHTCTHAHAYTYVHIRRVKKTGRLERLWVMVTSVIGFDEKWEIFSLEHDFNQHLLQSGLVC